MDPGSGHQVSGTTVFTTDAGVREATQQQEMMLDPVFYKNPENYTETSLAFYLARPLRIQSGTLGATDTATSFNPIALPQQALTNTFYNEKPKGRFGFRATIVLRLVVNADRFQQGRYMLCWCPLGGATYAIGGGQKGNGWVNNHMATLVQRTNLPRVEFDIACDTEVTLRIPFSSTHDFYQFDWANAPSTGLGTWGVARLFPYENLSFGTGTAIADYHIFVHFEDVEFVGFSNVGITVQSASIFKTSVKKRNASQAEAEQAGVGPITGITRKIAHASQILSPLPMLGPFMGSLSWVSSILSDASNVFGWSAPSNIEKVTRMQRTNFPYLVNTNKVDNSLPMGFTSDNMVDVAPGFAGTNIDEMDITYLCSIPTYRNRIAWTTATTVGSINSILVSPNFTSAPIVYNTLNNFSIGPLTYMCYLFPMWRGSITYKFKLVKTEFHSGRLAITYSPNSLATPSNIADLDYLHRDIIDIREHSEFSITIPWTQPSEYVSTTGGDNGRINVWVYDRLQCPDAVSQEVQILVEACGGPDIEFAGSHSRTAINFNQDFVIQSADIFGNKSGCAILSKPVGTTSIPQFQVDTSRLCIGERVMSLRSLLKSVWGIDHVSPAANKIFRFYPYLNPVANVTTGTASISYASDLIGQLSMFYCYSRGSIRTRFAPLTSNNTTWVASLGYTDFVGVTTSMGVMSGTSAIGGAAATNDVSRLLAHSSVVLTDVAQNDMMEVQSPMYARCKSRNNAMSTVGSATSASNNIANNLSFIEFSTYDNSADKPTFNKFILARSGGDDLNFGMFTSIPPFFITTALN